MNSRFATRTLGVALAAFALAAGAAFAQPVPRTPEGKWWKRPRVVREVGLSADQVDRLERIFLRVRPQLIDLRAELEKKQTTLQSLMEGASVDAAEASRRIDEVETARAKLAKARAMMLVEFRGVLTPEQWERLRAFRDAVRERRRERLRGAAPGDGGAR